MNTLKYSFLLAAMLGANAGLAMDRLGMTEAEARGMPPVCIAKMTGGELAKQWSAMVGPDFVHVHHYCMGINFLSRAYGARDRQDRGFQLKNAHDNLMYMVKAASPAFVIMPDVYLNLGIVYRMRSETGQAIASFQKAIELNPQASRAYRELADSYVTIGDRAKALAIITDGLRQNPETRSLQRLYAELGGKLPYPEPIAKSAPDSEAAPAVGRAEQNAGAKAAPEPLPPVAQPDGTNAGAGQAPQESQPQPVPGSPTNPYCRFCPQE